MAPATQPHLAFPAKIRQETTAVSRPRDVLAMLQHNILTDAPSTGLIVVSGHAAVYRLGLCAAADRALAGETVLYLAGANIFDPFLVGRLARAHRVTPSRVLQRIHVSRAFTCHQMTRLVTDCQAQLIERVIVEPAAQPQRLKLLVDTEPFVIAPLIELDSPLNYAGCVEATGPGGAVVELRGSTLGGGNPELSWSSSTGASGTGSAFSLPLGVGAYESASLTATDGATGKQDWILDGEPGLMVGSEIDEHEPSWFTWA